MFTLKGFVTHELFINNTPGALSAFGELSTQALTYSKEKGYYTNDTYQDVTLVAFASRSDAAQVLLAVDKVDLALQLSAFVYDKTISTSLVYTANELATELISTFAAQATDIEVGVVVDTGSDRMPEFISYRTGTVGESDETRVKLWFVDQAFRNQYDEYEIVIIPPLEPLDDFYRLGSDVEALLKVRTYPEEMEKIQIAKGDHPETIIRAELYDYVDPLNSAHTVPSKWSLLIYGAAGDNIDIIKDALVDYILANSTHTRDEWKNVLPDIFRRTEFVLVPFWNQYAIPNRTLQAGIYSPVANLTGALALIKEAIVGYPGSHIDLNAAVMGHPYKSLTIGVVGGPENRDGKFKITDEFPDYINVSSTSLDFNRMADWTKDWLLILANMIQVSEDMGDYTNIPIGMTRVTRDGMLYLVKNYKNIHYLVAAKKNFPDA